MTTELNQLRSALRERDAALSAVLGADLPELSQVERFSRYRQWFVECRFDDYMDMLDAAIEFKSPHPPALSRDLSRRIVTVLYRAGEARANYYKLIMNPNANGDDFMEAQRDNLEFEAYRAWVQRDYEIERKQLTSPTETPNDD